MQLYADAGSEFVTVEFEPQDVRTFASSWPCFHRPERVRYTFERDSGDLVDIEPIEFDGPESSAMAEDVWSYFEVQRPDSFRDWRRAELDADQLTDLARYGADAGFPGLTIRPTVWPATAAIWTTYGPPWRWTPRPSATIAPDVGRYFEAMKERLSL